MGASLNMPLQDISRASTREDAVLNAVLANDLMALQELSLMPGGFGEARKRAWPYLLGVSHQAILREELPHSDKESELFETWSQSESSSPHSPKHSSPYLSNSSLHVSISEFIGQGVEYSPHPDEHQVQLDTNRSFILYPIENRSVSHKQHLKEDLHDIILGVLRKRPTLRYYQGYHDIITVLFLTLPLELVLPSAEKLSLHRLRDSMGSGLEPLIGQLRVLKRLLRIIDPPYAEILEKDSPLPYYALSNLLTLFAHDVPTLPLIQHVFDWLLCREPIASIWLGAAVILSKKDDVLALERKGEEAMGMMHAVLSALPSLSEDDPECLSNGDKVNLDHPNEESPSSPDASAEEGTSATSLDSSWQREDAVFRKISSEKDLSPVDPGTNPEETGNTMRLREVGDINPLESSEVVYLQTQSETPSRSNSTSRSLPGQYKEKPPPSPLPLSTLLRQASHLLTAYPPSSPKLRLSETFGSQSAMHANGSVAPRTLSSLHDDEAEACVGGRDVILPLSEEEQEEEYGPPKKPKESVRHDNARKRRPPRISGIALRRQTVVASVILLLGVAVSLYGFKPEGRGAKLGSANVRWIATWMGGLLGVGGRLGIGLREYV
ncbi:hypothetical protein K439DRAFT_1659568 [Ramaria rubella]|nr:hypothetical protein K439DRAFT_1659568 [Ramaria rubella]